MIKKVINEKTSFDCSLNQWHIKEYSNQTVYMKIKEEPTQNTNT